MLPDVFSEPDTGKKQEPPREKTRDELLTENAALKMELSKIQKERDDLVIALSELRSFMFRMNQEFKRLDQIEKK